MEHQNVIYNWMCCLSFVCNNLTLVNYNHTKDALQMLNCPGKAQCLEEGGGGSISVLSTPYDQQCLFT